MVRRQNDFYPTSKWATEYMIDSVPLLDRGVILEPCCGAKDIVGAIEKLNPDVFTCDISSKHNPDLVIALLRISYSEPCRNRAWWLWQNQDRQSILYLPKRVSFTGDRRTDNVATAWFIWGKTERVAPAFTYPAVEGNMIIL